jgi:hypothetical protein
VRPLKDVVQKHTENETRRQKQAILNAGRNFWNWIAGGTNVISSKNFFRVQLTNLQHSSRLASEVFLIVVAASSGLATGTGIGERERPCFPSGPKHRSAAAKL